MSEPPPDGPRHISDVLTDLTVDPDIDRRVRRAIARALKPHQPHRHCPCPECMRDYLRSAEGKAG